MLRAPDGFTFRGMPPGWIRARRPNKIKELKKENEELKNILRTLIERIERIEGERKEE